MKGLELCRRYYDTYGVTMINQFFSGYRWKIAAGMVGEGSECLGFDDVVSRDHDWGPGFCLWLVDDDFDAIGESLQAAYEKLPKVFMGFNRKIADLSNQKVGVFRISDFYSRFTGLPHAPQNIKQWLPLSDEYLCAATNGKVFTDPLGYFSTIRHALLDYYPEDIRRFKLASACLRCAQSGQYNFARSIQRQERFAAAYALSTFCSQVMDLVFLLRKKYTPFYKWKHRAVKNVGPFGSEIHDRITDLLTTQDDLKKKDIIENISASVIVELKHQQLSDSDSDFLLDHGQAIQQRIIDPMLQKRDPWGG